MSRSERVSERKSGRVRRRSASAFQAAIELYERYQLIPDFFTELAEHLHNGIVIVRPSLFVMGKAVLLEDGRPAVFVAAAVGNLSELLEHLPRSLPWIAFRRHGESRVRVYATKRFCRFAAFGLYPNDL